MKNPHALFIIVTVIIHALMLTAGVFFFGVEYTCLLAFFWMLGWVHYCCILQKKDAATYEAASYYKLVLIGGIFCWILCPTAFIPRMHRTHKEPVPWSLLLKAYLVFSGSVVRVMQIIFALAQEAQEELAAQDVEGQQEQDDV